uniref:Selenoprotein M n=1 Tax=Salvator merianae TaxID=96440 RepID=A0A8D0BS23_SALMN
MAKAGLGVAAVCRSPLLRTPPDLTWQRIQPAQSAVHSGGGADSGRAGRGRACCSVQMARPLRLLLPLLVLVLLGFRPRRAFELDWQRLEGLARGKVEVRLRGPEWGGVADSYCSHNLDMKHLPGSDPELVLLNSKYEELQRIPLTEMTRLQINRMVKDLGFYRKESPDSPVPEEFQHAPAKPLLSAGHLDLNVSSP